MVVAGTYTDTEMMVVAASRCLADGQRVLVGVGMPNLAACLALRLHAPNLVLIFESGVVGSHPQRLPLSIGDSVLSENAQVVCSMYELFNYYLQGGLIDVGFLGGAQIDQFGNINSTVIGPYDNCRVRLPGSGGACEIAIHARRTIIMTRQDAKRFPAKVDFITSPGYLNGRKQRARLGMPGGGPELVITNLGIYQFDADGKMYLSSIHPGVSFKQVSSNLGWDANILNSPATTDPPTAEELHVLRQLDADGIYLGAAS